MVTLIICAASILPLLTIARSSLAPTARMVACGGLITAVKSLMPYMPRLETAVVPPWYSSGLSFRERARAAKSFISADIVDSDPDVGMLVLEHAAFGPAHVAIRNPLQRDRHRLDDEIVHRELVERLLFLVLGCRSIDLLARRE